MDNILEMIVFVCLIYERMGISQYDLDMMNWVKVAWRQIFHQSEYFLLFNETYFCKQNLINNNNIKHHNFHQVL